MSLHRLHRALLLVVVVFIDLKYAQVTSTTFQDLAAASTAIGDAPPSSLRTYRNYTTTVEINTERTGLFTSIDPITSTGPRANGTSETTAESSTSVTLLVGSQTVSSVPNGTDSAQATVSQTLSAPGPINTTPCNGHASFCSRKYSNITHIAAHNSPFVREANAATNQELPVLTQLQDGVRMLQFPTHWNDSEQTFHLCHTSCNILDAGTLESYLRTVTSWLKRHPYDVITILMTNHDASPPQRYVDPVISSGLIDYVYIAPKVPMGIQDWPTLQEMIFANTRAVVMLDYEANQEEVPWLHDEFAQMFETPFSPTDRDFPCVADRPPADWPGALPRENRMYMANHNLNIAVSLAGLTALVPNTVLLNETNAALAINGSVERTSQDCVDMWDRPPNFLLVDFYNIGNFNGSVFEVAAEANNVPYDQSSCCGTPPRSAAICQRSKAHARSGLLVGLIVMAALSLPI